MSSDQFDIVICMKGQTVRNASYGVASGGFRLRLRIKIIFKIHLNSATETTEALTNVEEMLI